jgi:hypothetical protein
MNLPSPSLAASLDPKDPRTRFTFADVAMRLVNDGPWYAVIAVLLVLALRGTTTAGENLIGLALTMLARSKPPEFPDKAQLLKGISGALAVLVVVAAAAAARAAGEPTPRRAVVLYETSGGMRP